MLGVRRWTFSAPIQLRAWWETAGKMPACPTGKMPVLQECDVKNWRPEFGVGCWEFGVGRSLLRFNSERGGRRQARCLPAPQARCLCYRNVMSKIGVLNSALDVGSLALDVLCSDSTPSVVGDGRQDACLPHRQDACATGMRCQKWASNAEL